MTCTEQQDREIYETFSFDKPGDETKLVSMLEKLFKYCNPRMNITILRHMFFTYQQHGTNGTTLPFFRYRTEKAEFRMTLYDPLIKDRIGHGTNDNSLRERLLCESELTLPKTISDGHAAAETHKDAREILKSNETFDLHKILKRSKFTGQTSMQAKEIIKKCKFCQNSHHRGKCPA